MTSSIVGYQLARIDECIVWRGTRWIPGTSDFRNASSWSQWVVLLGGGCRRGTRIDQRTPTGIFIGRRVPEVSRPDYTVTVATWLSTVISLHESPIYVTPYWAVVAKPVTMFGRNFSVAGPSPGAWQGSFGCDGEGPQVVSTI